MNSRILKLENSVRPEYVKVIKEAIISKKEILLNNKDKYSEKTVVITKVDNEINAKSDKIYNLTKIDLKEIGRLLLQYSLLSKIEDTVSMILSVLLFIYELSNDMKIELTQREAKIIYVFYCLDGNFTENRIRTKYNEFFATEITDIELFRSIEKLEELKTIKKNRNGEYTLIEELKFIEK